MAEHVGVMAGTRIGHHIALHPLTPPVARAPEVWVVCPADAPFDRPQRVLKLLPPTSEFGRVRAEMAALRTLRLPGIPRLIEIGEWAGRPFIVSDLAPGRPFPGAETPMPWATLEPIARRLLILLASVHRAGFVHCDLKPANVLVHGEAVTLIDFGLAARRHSGRVRGGSWRYAAPEQRHGEHVGAATDLYAVGLLIIEALIGEYHGFARTRRALEALPDLPTHLPAAIMALVAPTDRPRSAEQVLRTFSHPEPIASLALATVRHAASPATLARLFSGPEPIFHLPSDAAAELFARTAGRSAFIRAELQAWVDCGLALPDGDRLLVDQAALAQLQAGLSVSQRRTLQGRSALVDAWRPLLLAIDLAWPVSDPATLRQLLAPHDIGPGVAALLAAGAIRRLPDDRLRIDGARLAPIGSDPADPPLLAQLADRLPPHAPQRPLHLARAGRIADAATLALDRARQALATGDAFSADALLAAIAPLTDAQTVAPELRRALFATWTEAAFYLHGDRHLDAVLVGMGGDPIPDLAALLSAQVYQAPIPGPFDAPALEMIRRFTLRRLGLPVPAPDGTPLLAAQARIFEARRRYQAFEWADAARAFEAAAVDLPYLLRQATWLDAGSAWLEAQAFDRAQACVDRVLPGARRLRHGYYEGRAHWLQRAIRHRAGARLAEAPDWERAVVRFDFAPLTGLALLNEAAIAWHAKRRARCAALADRAAAAWDALDQPWPALLARALAGAARRRPLVDLPPLAEICAQPTPGAALQILALIAAAGGSTPALRRAARRVIPPPPHTGRLAVLSVAEALALLA